MAALPDVVVLIVGTHSAAEQKALRRHLQRKRSVDDVFVIRTVFVRSFDEAWNATLDNTKIQAVVIRNGFPSAPRTVIWPRRTGDSRGWTPTSRPFRNLELGRRSAA
ncbi:hypothetical protein ACOJBM_41320 [Rhizobium beringeri]